MSVEPPLHGIDARPVAVAAGNHEDVLTIRAHEVGGVVGAALRVVAVFPH